MAEAAKPGVWNKPLFGTAQVRKDSPEDNGLLWKQVTSGSEPISNLVLEEAAFPGARFPHLALMCEAHFTDKGIFLVGMARLNNNDVKPIRLGGAAFLIGGMAGGIGQNMTEARNAKLAIKSMKNQYAASVRDLAAKPLAVRFAESRYDVYHLPSEEIEEVVIGEAKGTPAHVKTVIGVLELPAAITDQQRDALRAWKEQHCPAAKVGTPSPVWTIGKAALHIRMKNIVDDRMLPFLAAGNLGAERDLKLCEVFSTGLNQPQYWTFVERVATSGQPGGKALAYVAAKYKRKKAFSKVAFAFLSFLGALAAMAASCLGMSVGGPNDGPFVLVLGGLGLILGLLGFVLMLVAFGDFRRSGKYLSG